MNDGTKKRIAVVGAGLIGRRHIDAVQACGSASLAAVVDPDDQSNVLASAPGVPRFERLEQLLDADIADGIVLSTPNQLHVQQAMDCIACHLPVLVEKPLAIDLKGAMEVVSASESSGVPVLVGHHRRHNPIIARARKLIVDGQLGELSAVHANTWFYKPEDYYDVEWRTQQGAGPVYLNLIHDVDMLRYLCGEVSHVQAMESNKVRGHEVEDTAVIMFRFLNGALATLSVSDCTVSPWSWELTARENPAYAVTQEQCYQIGGTHGSLALPNLTVWKHQALRSWWEPISAESLPFESADPLLRQIEQFIKVIDGVESPLASARDGLLNQQVIEAIKIAAASGNQVELSSPESMVFE